MDKIMITKAPDEQKKAVVKEFLIRLGIGLIVMVMITAVIAAFGLGVVALIEHPLWGILVVILFLGYIAYTIGTDMRR